MEIAALTREMIHQGALDAERPIVIDIWGPQCRPCLALAPTFEALAEQHRDQAEFFKLEAPKNRMACVDLKVMNLPTFLAYSGGREVARLSGEINANQLTAFVQEAVEQQRGENND